MRAGDVNYEIRDARWSDCGAMSRKLCDGRWLAYKAAGVDPRAQLRGLWATSSVRRSCLIDGRLVAMWGMAGTLLSRCGQVWLVIADEASRHPYALLREVKRQLAEFSSSRKELKATIAAQDGTALRFATFIGFKEDGAPVQIAGADIFVVPMRR